MKGENIEVPNEKALRRKQETFQSFEFRERRDIDILNRYFHNLRMKKKNDSFNTPVKLYEYLCSERKI